MCQPKPGPRCASDMGAVRDKAKSKLDGLRAEEKAYAKSPEGSSGTEEAFQTRTAIRVNIQDAEYAYVKALDEYDFTPTGIKELKDQYKEAVSQKDREKATTLGKRIRRAEDVHERRTSSGKHVQSIYAENVKIAKGHQKEDEALGREWVMKHSGTAEQMVKELNDLNRRMKERYEFSLQKIDEQVDHTAHWRDYKMLRKNHEHHLRTETRVGAALKALSLVKA